MPFILCKTPVLNITYFKEYSVFQTENFITCPLYNYSEMTTFQIDWKKWVHWILTWEKREKKTWLACVAGRRFLLLLLCFLFAAQNVRDKAGQKQKGGQMSLWWGKVWGKKANTEQLVYSLCVLSLTPCPHNFIVWPLTMKNTRKKRLLCRPRLAENKPGCQCSMIVIQWSHNEGK